MTTMTYTGTLRVVTCWCGIVHAVPYDLDDYANRMGVSVYCPLGHAWIHADNIKKQLEQEQARGKRLRELLDDERNQHHRTERRLQATRGVVTRTKRRIAAGACPRCHARFADLKDHMQAEHPDYVAHLG